MKEIKTGLSASYYTVPVMSSVHNQGAAYLLECIDALEALRLTYAESNVIKAIWRTASKRVLNVSKAGVTDLYDMEKVFFFCAKIHKSSLESSTASDDRFPVTLSSVVGISCPENIAQPPYVTGLTDVRNALKLTKDEFNLVSVLWLAACKRVYVGSSLYPYTVYGASDRIILETLSERLLETAKNG